MSAGQEYEAQVRAMIENGKRWLVEHPGESIIVQYNFQNVAVISTIGDALRNHFVSTNAPGLALIKALWPWDRPDEPTVIMVQTALENVIAWERVT